MAKAKTIEQILAENGLAFAPNMEQHYMEELEGIWNEACEESGGEITDARIDEYLDVLKKMGLAIPVHRETMEREHSRHRAEAPDPEVIRMRKLISEEKASERSKKAEKKATLKAHSRKAKKPFPQGAWEADRAGNLRVRERTVPGRFRSAARPGFRAGCG